MVSPGQIVVTGNVVQIATARVPAKANTKTYVFLDMTAGVISTNTTGFTAGNYPVAIASANATYIYSLQDARPDVFGGSGGGVGTITGVTAGNGLSGGGAFGAVTLSLTTGCSLSQILQWNGTAWVCSDPTTVPNANSTTSGILQLNTDLSGTFNAPTVVNGSHIVNGSVGPNGLASTAVTPGTYTSTNITVDQQGRITSAANGTVGTGDVKTAPPGSQIITQPASAGVSTPFTINNFGNVRMVTPSWNWAQTDSSGSIGNLGTAGSNTLTLAPCPLGIDTTPAAHHYSYTVYVSGVGTPEAAQVTGGTCTPGLASGTVVITTINTHAAGFTAGSSTSGIQEAWNDAWVNDTGAAPVSSSVASPDVRLLSGTTYTVQASIYLRGRGGVLDGRGALIACQTRDRCVYIGTTQGFPFVNHHKLYNLTMTTSVQVNGANVANVSAVGGIYSIQTAAAHPFVLGDTVICEYHSQNAEQKWVSPITSVADNTHFQVQFGALSFSTSATTFGVCNIENAAIENNSDHVILQDFNLASVTGIGGGEFNEGIVNDNDQQFQITRATNRSHGIINPSVPNVSTSTWPIGSFFFQRTDQTLAGIMYVHDSELTNVNCADSGGNGFVMENSVCQGFPMWAVRYSGGLQPATLSNVYQEGGGSATNSLFGYAAQAGYILQGGSGGIEIGGTFPIAGLPPTFLSSGGGGACTVSQYFVVAQTSIGRTAPFYIGSSNPTNCNGANVLLQWSSIALQDSTGTSVGTLTWDIIRTIGASTVAPFGALAGGGVNSGSIAIGNSGSCLNGMCSFTDTQAAAAAYTVNSAQIAPVFWFWPASLVVNKGPVYVDSIGTGAGVVAANGTVGVSVIAKRCQSTGNTGQKTPSWVQCLATDGGGGSGSIATVIQQTDTAGNGPVANSKGRINLGKSITAPNDLITLQDANLPKTFATNGNRPSNDAGDMAIGIDQANGLSVRAGTSISEYIGIIPDNSTWQEHLTSTLKSFAVPVRLIPVTFASLPACAAGTDGITRGVSDSTTQTGGATITGGGSFHVLGYCNGTNWIVASGGGGGSVNVNGSPVASPNFGNLPAAGTNGINVTFQASGSNASAYLPGDGTASHFLNGTGAFSTALTGVVSNQGLSLSGGNAQLIQTCSNAQVLSWNTTNWVCASPGTGTVTTVSGTGSQISVATGTSTPVLSLTAPLAAPGDVQLLNASVLSWPSSPLGISADASASTLDVGNGTAGDASASVRANGYTGTGVAAGDVVFGAGNGTCPSPSPLTAILCNNGGTGNLSVSQNNGAYTGLAFLGLIPFDSTNLSAPTAAAAFPFPATLGLTLSGTAPVSTSSNGTAAGALLTVTTPTGGATTGSATTAGNGGTAIENYGNGGSASGGTNAKGGQGGGKHISLGNGGASSGTSVNSAGGDLEITGGLAGTGGSGTAGRQSTIIIDQTVTNAITSSPKLIIRGTYEDTAGPTFANNDWSLNDVEQSSTVNGKTTLNIAQSGSSGTAAVAVPTLILGTNTAGVLAGTMTVNNATSGSILVTPPTGALGTPTLTWPIATGTLAATTGALTSGNCAKFDASGRLVDAATVCSTGSGTVNSGTIGHLGFYATSAAAISDAGADLVFNGTHTYTGSANLVFDMSAGPVLTGLKFPAAAGAAPVTENLHAFNTTNHTYVFGSNGNTIVAAAAATGTNTATTCSNQFVSAISGIAAPTCTTITLASAAFANQGTTSTVLHGNAAGNPSFGAVGSTDIASSVALAGSPTTTTQSQNDNSTKISTTAYTDLAVSNAVAGLDPSVAVLAASTASLTGTYSNGASGIGATFTVTATGAFTLDGISIGTIGQRVLLKNQSSGFQNGVYSATVVGTTGVSPIFTRALDYNQPSNINTTGAVPVQSGTVNADTSWLLTSTVTTVGTDALTYTQFTQNAANVVLAVAPGAGLCHFAGSTQTCTSSAVSMTADVTGILPLANGGTNANLTAANGALPYSSGSAIALLAPGTAGQIPRSGGAGAPTWLTFPDTKYAPAADCVNAVAGSAWSTGATPAALCRAGTNNKTGLLSPWGASDVAYVQFHIDADADLTTTLPNLMLELTSTDATNGHTIIMQESVACAKEDGTTTDDVAFNAARSFATITLNGNANRVWKTTITLNSTDLTGCAAPGILWVKVSRTTDTATNLGIYGLNVTTYRLLTAQAN